MNLIDEMVEYCAENGLIDKSHALKLYQMGLIERLPEVFETDYDNSADYEYIWSKPFRERRENEEDILDMTGEALSQSTAKSKRRAKGGARSKGRANQDKLTAVQLNEHLKETFDQILANRELLRTVTLPARYAKIPIPPRTELTEKALFDALVALNSLSDDELDNLLIAEFNTFSPRHLMLNDVYRGWHFPFASDFSSYYGPAVNAFRQFFCSGYRPEISGKYAWILKQFRVNSLFQFIQWEWRLFESVRKIYQQNRSQFFNWSDPYHIAGNLDWYKIRKQDILSCLVAAILSPLVDSDSASKSDSGEYEQSLSAPPRLGGVYQVTFNLSLGGIHLENPVTGDREYVFLDQENHQLRKMSSILAMALDANKIFEKSEQLRQFEQGKKGGDRRVETISGVDYAFCWCPPGTFMMGSPANEAERYEDESQHEVTLTRGFWLLETPVTQLMWQSVMGRNPSYFKGDNIPVESVSWDDCQEFIDKLNVLFKSSLRFRFPSESEWEYACRAGTTTPFNFGGVLNGDKANCNGNYPYGTDERGPYLHKTTQVKSYAPNTWGLYDMHGNVLEWCNDWYDSDYYRKSPSTDPTGPASGSIRVCRGGSWNYRALRCRSADRNRGAPGYWYSGLGFRLALSLPY